MFLRSLALELRSRLVRSTLVICMLAVTLSMYSGVLTGDPGPPLVSWRFAPLFALGSATRGAEVLTVMAILAVTTQFKFRTIGQTVSWMGGRSRFIAAVTTVNCAIAIVVTIVTLAINWIVLYTIYDFAKSPLPLLGVDVFRLAGLTLGFVCLWVILGTGLAMLIPDSGFSMGAYFGIFVIGDQLVSSRILTRSGPEAIPEWLPSELVQRALAWNHATNEVNMYTNDPFAFMIQPSPIDDLHIAMLPLVTVAVLVFVSGCIRFRFYNLH